MKVINILHDSIVDGAGFRSVVFFSGCIHHCHGCHNPQSWNITNGKDMSQADIFTELIENELTNVTLSGGDPFLQSKEVSELAKALKDAGKNIWCYTGYLFEDLLGNPFHRHLLEQIDVLVDGPFELAKRDLSLLYKGSNNQRIIDVPRSLTDGRIQLYKQ
ncbi:anaerobic ribonucleoside-triphosphate reductase activating protein [Bacillus sp. DNRA2]|uniref:anaerobic ribonucleoside-triphosphate reductase activating protein n=1 Tax=Bacillus sp. DNRA2 TaxID=2723053 RepID=UPI00145CD236|nr:anaerobic ribonucleoside-triphosphate reductase activating protein [Bacillus sp. DNRA2]NMD71323.1 anaerobic ribonucleoside-triphosphate reductase activating protein [Bacillus sp. DNRA2]